MWFKREKSFCSKCIYLEGTIFCRNKYNNDTAYCSRKNKNGNCRDFEPKQINTGALLAKFEKEQRDKNKLFADSIEELTTKIKKPKKKGK